MTFDPDSFLKQTGLLPDEEIDVARAGLALAASAHPGISIGRYESHLEKLGQDVAQRHKFFLKEGSEDSAETQLAALRDVLFETHGYTGDTQTHDDLQNADLMRVIDRRKGLSITLSFLYIHAGGAQGWDVRALRFPGHMLCRIEKEGARLIFDPFAGGKIMHAPDLRDLAKRMMGPQAELSSSYYEVSAQREILIRLQNNIKLRQIEAGEYELAARTIEKMRLIDPEEWRLLLDAGVLYARLQKKGEAVQALEAYLAQAPKGRTSHEAALLLQELKDN